CDGRVQGDGAIAFGNRTPSSVSASTAGIPGTGAVPPGKSSARTQSSTTMTIFGRWSRIADSPKTPGSGPGRTRGWGNNLCAFGTAGRDLLGEDTERFEWGVHTTVIVPVM